MDSAMNIVWDTILNAIGYMSAGALAVLLYSLIKRRLAQAPAQTTKQKQPTQKASAPAKQEKDGPRFVTLKSPANHPDRPADFRRDRIQVIGQAREMIMSGESSETIRRALPISEAELALLSYDSK
jgi:hypothetical protein